MTGELPQSDVAFDAPAKHINRRQLVKIGAWAAPALVLAVSTPSASASPGIVPASQLTVTTNTLSAVAAGVGPLSWAGGSILWTKSGTGQPTLAMVSYTVTLTGPGGLSYGLYTGTQNVAPGGTISFPVTSYGTAPMALGDYRVTITAVSDGAASGQSNTLTLAGSPVPVAQLTPQAYGLSNLNSGGTPGPVGWAGGQIGWWSTPSGSPAYAAVSYTAVLTGPGNLSYTLSSGTVNIPKGGSYTIPSASWGVKPILGGVYQVTLTVTSTGSASVQSSTLTIVAPVAAATPTVVPTGGNKHNVTVKFTGPAGAVVGIAVTSSSNVNWAPAFPTTATIGSDGTVSITREANATGSAGTVSFTFSGTYVSVSPNKYTGIVIPK